MFQIYYTYGICPQKIAEGDDLPEVIRDAFKRLGSYNSISIFFQNKLILMGDKSDGFYPPPVKLATVKR